MNAYLKTREGFLDAEKTYEEALKQAPDDCTIRRAFGELLLDEKEYESAAGQFETVRDKCPWLPAVYTDLGFVEEGMGRDNEAIAYFRKALELGFDLATTHTYLGIVLGNQGKSDEAMAQYRKALEINPAHESARLNLADQLTKTGHFDEALSHFNEILETNEALFRRALKSNPCRVTAKLNNKDQIIAASSLLEIDSSLRTQNLFDIPGCTA